MNVPKGFKQTEAGVIPKDWEVQPLESITDPARPISYGIVQTGALVTGGIRCLRVLDINNGKINKTNLITTSKQISTAYKRTVLKLDDLVMPLRGKVGDVGQIDQELVGCNLTRGVALISIRPQWSATYCKQIIASCSSISRMEQLMNGSALQEIPIATLRSFKIPLPPTRAEQTAIATALSDMDALIEGVEKLLEKKRRIKQGAMQELLKPKKGWVCHPIKSFTDATAGGTPSTEIDRYWNGNIRWMNSGELHLKRINEVEGRITESGLKNSSTRLLPKYCVLIGLAGQGRTRGTVAINQVELCTNQSIAAIFPNDSFVPDYLYYNLDIRYSELRKLSTGDGGRGGLNLTLIRAVEIPFPPTIDEQRQIVHIFNDMDKEIEKLKTQRTKYQQLKTGMMQELLTGKKRLV